MTNSVDVAAPVELCVGDDQVSRVNDRQDCAKTARVGVLVVARGQVVEHGSLNWSAIWIHANRMAAKTVFLSKSNKKCCIGIFYGLVAGW